MKITNEQKKCVDTFLHKTVIPASLGDDTGMFAPHNGAYQNEIVEYESNGALYIYSTEGIYTKFVSVSQFKNLEQRVKALEERQGA